MSGCLAGCVAAVAVSPCDGESHFSLLLIYDIEIDVYKMLRVFSNLTANINVASSPVVKTRLQSLKKGANEETYNGVVDCVR